jgi:uroporphyrin-III C-methyltransferase
MKGKVYLVGAGPGDPELLTLRALRLLQTADAVLHDDLVAPEILALIPSTAQIFNVGKRCGKKKVLQAEIHCLMVKLASEGLHVVRLKGGDPLIFGRAGEEIESLRRNSIPFEIVPGVTSALGAAAAAQIPLTHRETSSALVLITASRASQGRASERRYSKSGSAEGRDCKGCYEEEDGTDWSKFVASGATLVIYMPGQNYSDISSKLISAGLSGDTPCAVISRATTRHQRTHRTKVRDLHRTPQLASPSILIVGEVVSLGARLDASLDDPLHDPAIVAQAVLPDPSGNSIPFPATLLETFLTGPSPESR